jgi:tetratricopeptide (TPR) repeat protein
MKKLLITAAACLLVLGASCKTLKREITVKTPVTVDEQKSAETSAKSMYDEGKYDDAISYLQALIKKEPKNPVYWSQLGSAYAQMNAYKNSVYAYRQAIKFDPKNIKAMYNLSIVYSENGSHREAQKIIEQALKISPKNAMVQASLGNVLIDEEKFDKARKVYEQIVEAKPDFDVGHFNLGVINYQQRNLDAAQKNYEDVLKINANDSEAKENLAAIHIIKNDYEDAVDYLLEVVNSSPDDDITLENAYYNLGVAYLRLKKYKQALESFESAINIEPWDMAAYVNSAILCEELGYKDRAIKYWQKYDRLLPVNKRKKEIQERLKRLGAKIEATPEPAPQAGTITAQPGDKAPPAAPKKEEVKVKPQDKPQPAGEAKK